MLTSLYHVIPTLKSLLSGSCMSLPGGYNSRSLLMGILGKLARQDEMTISSVANLFGVTRQGIYKNIHRLTELDAQIKELPSNITDCLLVTSQKIDETILSLALDAHAPLEGIQRVLTCVYGANGCRSIGYISTLLAKAGKFAEKITQTIPLHDVTQGANDEIFDAFDNPVLTGVDVESSYIYLMLDMLDRKGETWELALDSLKDSGLSLKVAISDAGTGLLKGVKAAFPDVQSQIDVFHVLRDIGRTVYKFKEHVMKELARCYELEKAVANYKNPWHKKTIADKNKLADCQEGLTTMVEDYDTLSCLYSWVHELMSFSGYTYDEVMELMEWLLDEMASIAKRHRWAHKLSHEITRFRKRLPATMLFLNRLFDDFAKKARAMGLPEEAFYLLYRRLGTTKDSEAYADLTRRAMETIGEKQFRMVEEAHAEIVGSIKRASSLVENVNSRLRAYMNIKKHVSSSFYSLVQLHMNTKKYRRSRVKSRQGRSPVEILTDEEWPELIELFEKRGFWSDGISEKAA